MNNTDLILKDLNMITNNIRSAIMDAYEQGKIDGSNSENPKLKKIEDIVSCERDCSRPPSDCYECMDGKLKAIEQIVKG